MKYFAFITLIILPSCLISQVDYKRTERENKIDLYSKLQNNISQVTDNQIKYDVKYYLLNLNVDPGSMTIIGKVQIRSLICESISTIEINLTNQLIVDSVFTGNSRLTFSQLENLLTINLGGTYSPNEIADLMIFYHGTPNSSGFGSFRFYTRSEDGIKKDIIWTLSEPFGARDWWPCKDYPYDKADSVDIIITVPKDLIVASNGLLVETIEKNTTKTYHWHESYPIATYLISFTAYPYKVYTNYYCYNATDTMKIQNYIFPDYYNEALLKLELVPDMIKIFSDLFGEYPFIKEKYGHAQFLWGGGMEHQTCTSLSSWSEYLMVHELSHSWWGDMITCQDFHHIWLNEGFATYSEALYAEKAYGTSSYKREVNLTKYYGSGTIYVSSLDNVSRIFSGDLTYNKASWVLHMLRHVVGDSTFFKILRTYYNDKRYQYNVATTADFQGICETVYGKDLGWFFDEWIYQEYYPSFYSSMSRSIGNNQTNIKITLNQTQSNYTFKMPIDFTFYSTSGDTTIVVFDSLKLQEFNFTLPGNIDSVAIDKDDWILKTITTGLTDVAESITPNNFILYQNYPNPFNNSTIISFYLNKTGNIKITLFDILGCEVMTIAEGKYLAGRHDVSLDAKNLSTGLYFYKFHTDGYNDVKKLILLK
jgi:aminopeptidase N